MASTHIRFFSCVRYRFFCFFMRWNFCLVSVFSVLGLHINSLEKFLQWLPYYILRRWWLGQSEAAKFNTVERAMKHDLDNDDGSLLPEKKKMKSADESKAGLKSYSDGDVGSE